MGAFIDLSHPLDENVHVYPGDPAFSCKQVCGVPEGGFAVSELSLSSHLGTHIDAPSHRVEGAAAIDVFPVDYFVRRALIVDVSGKSEGSSIVLSDLERYESRIEDGMAVLFYTGWDKYWSDKTGVYFKHPSIAREVAEKLMQLGATVVGVDTMSPDSMEDGADLPVHDIVLGAGRIIAENLTGLGVLHRIQEEDSTAVIMVSLAPLRLVGCDGSPVRAFAWIEHGK